MFENFNTLLFVFDCLANTLLILGIMGVGTLVSLLIIKPDNKKLIITFAILAALCFVGLCWIPTSKNIEKYQIQKKVDQVIKKPVTKPPKPVSDINEI